MSNATTGQATGQKAAHHAIAARDFSRTTLAALTAKGITVIGIQGLPGADGSFANGERGYCLDDNGTHRVRTHQEVLRLVPGRRAGEGFALIGNGLGVRTAPAPKRHYRGGR